MLADFFTKPLQGHLFRKFKAVLLGHAHVGTLALNPTAPVEERVGEGRSGEHGYTATGVVGTVPGGDRKTKNVTKLTWADVVRKPAVAGNGKIVPMVLSKGTDGSDNMSVLMRSFSQNNPVNRIKV